VRPVAERYVGEIFQSPQCLDWAGANHREQRWCRIGTEQRPCVRCTPLAVAQRYDMALGSWASFNQTNPRRGLRNRERSRKRLKVIALLAESRHLVARTDTWLSMIHPARHHSVGESARTKVNDPSPSLYIRTYAQANPAPAPRLMPNTHKCETSPRQGA
jgi:hypothetical protein